MQFQLPNINEMPTAKAIAWYTKEITEIFDVKNRIAGTYSDEYKDALLDWKHELTRRAHEERKIQMKGWMLQNG